MNKNFKHQHQRAPFVLALSIIALSLGLGKIFIDGKINLPAGLISLTGLISLGVIYVRVFKNRNTIRPKFSVNRFKTILLILGLGLILFDVNYLSHRFNLRLDVTQEKLHTLNPETVGLVQSIKQNVKMTVLYVGLAPKYLEDLLKEYSAHSKGRMTTEIIDPIVDIGYAAQFGNMINGRESKLIVQSGNERKDIDFSREVLTEELINNALMNVSRQKRLAYFLKGHQEYEVEEEGDTGLSKFVKILQMNNFDIAELVIGLNGQVPDNCDVLIVAGPKDELTEPEEQAINTYLEKGGDAFIMVENTVVTAPDKSLRKDQEDKNPSLNNILRKWGVEVALDIVVDLANHAGDDAGSPATKNYMTHRAIVKTLDYTFYVRPRSIMMIKDRRPTIRLAPLVLTASETQSWGETNRALKVKFDEGIDRPGPVPIAFVISEPKDKKKISATRLIVFTDADFLTNVYIDSYSNAEMGLNVVYWLTDLDYQPLMGKKHIEVNRLDLTSQQKRQVIVVLVFLPMLILMAGVMVWINKK